MTLQSAKVPEQVTEKVTDEVTKKVTNRVTESLIENDKKILEILAENPTATYVEIASKLNISRKTVAQRIRLLKNSGFIIRVDSARKGYWKLI